MSNKDQGIGGFKDAAQYEEEFSNRSTKLPGKVMSFVSPALYKQCVLRMF